MVVGCANPGLLLCFSHVLALHSVDSLRCVPQTFILLIKSLSIEFSKEGDQDTNGGRRVTYLFNNSYIQQRIIVTKREIPTR